MIDTLSRYLTALANTTTARALQPLFQGLMDRYAAQMLSPAGIIIFGGSSANAKTGLAAVLALTNNGNAAALVSVAASTTLTPNTGLTLINTFNVYLFYINGAGTISTSMGTAATTLAGVAFPQMPNGRACIGGFTVNPTAGTFTGATTALDAANTNVVYFSPVGPWDATVLQGAIQ